MPIGRLDSLLIDRIDAGARHVEVAIEAGGRRLLQRRQRRKAS
jgi:hypothetical protein